MVAAVRRAYVDRVPPGEAREVDVLTLELTALSNEDVRGIYGDNEDSMPLRCRFLNPAAAGAYLEMKDLVVVSDMFRSPESSLRAVRDGRGAQPPAYSAHNFGLAIDLDIGRTMKAASVKTKAALDAELESRGWFCHRRDHEMEHEAWHYNFLGRGTQVGQQFRSTAGWIEGRIGQMYGAFLDPDDTECQVALKKLRLYGGAIDGKIGPISQEAIRAFQRTWRLPKSGRLDTRTKRTLAYVAAERTT